MNKVILSGRVVRISSREKVAYLTLSVRTNRAYEYIDITTFSVEFVKKHITPEDYISVCGYIHINGKEHGYKVDIIGEDFTLLSSNHSAESFTQLSNEVPLPWEV